MTLKQTRRTDLARAQHLALRGRHAEARDLFARHGIGYAVPGPRGWDSVETSNEDN